MTNLYYIVILLIMEKKDLKPSLFVFFLIKMDVKPAFLLVVTYRKYKVHGECWLFLALPT